VVYSSIPALRFCEAHPSGQRDGGLRSTRTPLMLGPYLASAFAVAAVVAFRMTGQEASAPRPQPSAESRADGPEQKGLPALDR
jgi:hypothetical protein